MSIEIKRKTKALISLILGIALFVIFQVLSIVFGRFRELSFLSGVWSAFQYASCLFLVRTNRKRGIITSIILLLASLVNLLRVIVFNKENLPVAGLFNVLFYIITIIWLRLILRDRKGPP